MKNKLEDLRSHLFATLEALRDEDKPMEIDRAKTIAMVASTLIESAKVEVEFIKATGAPPARGFLQMPDKPMALLGGRLNQRA